MRLLILSSLIASTAHAVRFDPPDLTLEQELHRQYLSQKAVIAPLSPTKDSYIETYRIQKGETLWSLSETLYGDGHYWPRVWAQNKAITNPHLIRRGHSLQFLLGSEDATPSFRISEGDDAGVELASSANQNPLIEIPPPEIPPKRIINVPKSFPQWQSVYKQLPVQITDDKGLLRQRKPLVGKSYLTSFVQETELVSSGKFMETDLDSAMPVTNQYVYVKVNKGEGQVGQKMLIVRELGRLRRQHKKVEMPRAYLIQIAGEIELSEPATPEDEDILEEFDVFRALVTRAYNLSLRGFDLIPGEMEEVNLNYDGTPGVAEAQIIGSGKSVAADLFAPGDIVFLNKGSSSGLAPGQILDVFQDRQTRKRETEVRYSPSPSGTVRILRVTPGLSTAVILGARDGLMPGDKVQHVSTRASEREALEVKDGAFSKGADESGLESELEFEDPDFGGDDGDSDLPDDGAEF